MIITGPEYLDPFKKLLGDGSHLGIKLSYEVQSEPRGISDAFLIAEECISNENVTLILGDNIFYGHGFLDPIRNKINHFTDGAIVFGYPVKDPERYGVVEFDSNNKAISLEEKPKEPKSNYAVPGLYIYDKSVVSRTKNLSLSKRGELEITDLNRVYLEDEKLDVSLLGRGVAWLDTGTPESMIEASNFIAYIESRQGLKISCIEEVAFNMGFINFDQLVHIVNRMPSSSYKTYLESFININREI